MQCIRKCYLVSPIGNAGTEDNLIYINVTPPNFLLWIYQLFLHKYIIAFAVITSERGKRKGKNNFRKILFMEIVLLKHFQNI